MDKIFSGEIESKRNPEVFDYIDKQKKDEIARDDDNMRNVEGYTHGYVEPFLRQHMIKLAADYRLSSNLTTSFYYNHQTFRYAISTTFPRQAINAGFNFIYNLGGN